MRILTIDSAVGRCAVAVVTDGIAAGEQHETNRGQPGLLAEATQRVLAAGAVDVADLGLIAVTVGPGSFTGIRSAIALAQGLGLSAGVPVVGVTIGEALQEALPSLGHRALWSVVPSRPGRLFIETGGAVLSAAIDALPEPDGPVAVAGTASHDVASRLAARGANVMLTDARFPSATAIANAALKRLNGALPPRRAEPLYVDAPAVTLSAPTRGAGPLP